MVIIARPRKSYFYVDMRNFYKSLQLGGQGMTKDVGTGKQSKMETGWGANTRPGDTAAPVSSFKSAPHVTIGLKLKRLSVHKMQTVVTEALGLVSDLGSG